MDDLQFTNKEYLRWVGNAYVIDFDKVTTLQDVILVLKAMNLTVTGEEFIEKNGIRHLLKLKEAGGNG